MYVTKKNTLEIPFDFQTYMAKAEEKALMDSRATENFIDKGMVKQLKLGTRPLSPAQPVFNMDRTHNKAGTISKTIHLYVTLRDINSSSTLLT